MKAAWSGLSSCGTGFFFSRKAGTSGRVAWEQRWVYFILSHPTFALRVRKQFKNQKKKKATVQPSKLQLLCCLRQSKNLKGKNRKEKKDIFSRVYQLRH